MFTVRWAQTVHPCHSRLASLDNVHGRGAYRLEPVLQHEALASGLEPQARVMS